MISWTKYHQTWYWPYSARFSVLMNKDHFFLSGQLIVAKVFLGKTQQYLPSKPWVFFISFKFLSSSLACCRHVIKVYLFCITWLAGTFQTFMFLFLSFSCCFLLHCDVFSLLIPSLISPWSACNFSDHWKPFSKDNWKFYQLGENLASNVARSSRGMVILYE